MLGDAQCHVRRAQAQSPDGPGVLAAVGGVEYQAATPQRSLCHGMEGDVKMRPCRAGEGDLIVVGHITGPRNP